MIAIILLGQLVTAATAAAQPRGLLGQPRVSLNGGAIFPADDADQIPLGTGMSLGAVAAYPVLPYLDLRIDTEYGRFDNSDVHYQDRDMDITSESIAIVLGGRLHAFPDQTIDPFVSAGVGYGGFKVAGQVFTSVIDGVAFNAGPFSEKRDSVLYEIGSGVEWRVTHRLTAQLLGEYFDARTLDGDNDDFVCGALLHYWITDHIGIGAQSTVGLEVGDVFVHGRVTLGL